MYSQATPGLLNACIAGSDKFTKQKFNVCFLYLLRLEDQFSAKKDAVVHLQ